MVGMGRHLILGVTSDDPILSAIAPVGLAASAGTALIVDLVADAPVAGHGRTLRDISVDGPRLPELSPGRQGVAVVRGGGLNSTEVVDVIDLLSGRWPAVVIRVGNGDSPYPTVPVVPLFPGVLAPIALPPGGVWQSVRGGGEPPGPGPVLPRLSSLQIRRILAGHLPRMSRWVSAWKQVWEMPWG
jgi:hypothetical protein